MSNTITKYDLPGRVPVPQPAGAQVAQWAELVKPEISTALHVIARIKAERDELLEALIEVEQMTHASELNEGTMSIVREAIQKAIAD